MERKIFAMLLSSVMLFCAAVSCSKQATNEDPVTPQPTVGNLTITKEAQHIAIKVVHNCTLTCKIEAYGEWIEEAGSKAALTDTFRFHVAENEDYFERKATILFYGRNESILHKVFLTQAGKRLDPTSGKVCGLPAVWDFYALGYTNETKAGAQATVFARHWKTEESNPYCLATSGNASAYLKAFTKDPLYLKSGMTVTLNPSIQACGLMEGDWYQFTIPVRNLPKDTTICVSGATGGASGSSAFWMLEYSSDGEKWFEATDPPTAKVGSVTCKAHFWNTTETVGSKRTVYLGSSDPSYHSYRFTLSLMEPIVEGNLYLRLRTLPYSGKFDGSIQSKGWTDIKSFSVTL